MNDKQAIYQSFKGSVQLLRYTPSAGDTESNQNVTPLFALSVFNYSLKL